MQLAGAVVDRRNGPMRRLRSRLVRDQESLRAPMPITERILMAEHYGADNIALGVSGYQAKCDELRGFIFEPIRKYLADEMMRAGFDTAQVNAAWREIGRASCRERVSSPV